MFSYYEIPIKARPLQNGTGCFQPLQPIYTTKQDYSFPDYSMPDNLTHYYDPVTQVNCALVYLFDQKGHFQGSLLLFFQQNSF